MNVPRYMRVARVRLPCQRTKWPVIGISLVSCPPLAITVGVMHMKIETRTLQRKSVTIVTRLGTEPEICD